ncbi:hypothetical protein HZA26_00060 [Candidatus Nomurabacteria bacterium]|nr:hypothetical protein [Candidatus Nomurabacteria bacterium]
MAIIWDFESELGSIFPYAMWSMYGNEGLTVGSVIPITDGFCITVNRDDVPIHHRVGRNGAFGAVMEIPWMYMKPKPPKPTIEQQHTGATSA